MSNPFLTKAYDDLAREIEAILQIVNESRDRFGEPRLLSVGDQTAISNFNLIRLRDAKYALDRALGVDKPRRHAGSALHSA